MSLIFRTAAGSTFHGSLWRPADRDRFVEVVGRHSGHNGGGGIRDRTAAVDAGRTAEHDPCRAPSARPVPAGAAGGDPGGAGGRAAGPVGRQPAALALDRGDRPEAEDAGGGLLPAFTSDLPAGPR